MTKEGTSCLTVPPVPARRPCALPWLRMAPAAAPGTAFHPGAGTEAEAPPAAVTTGSGDSCGRRSCSRSRPAAVWMLGIVALPPRTSTTSSPSLNARTSASSAATSRGCAGDATAPRRDETRLERACAIGPEAPVGGTPSSAGPKSIGIAARGLYGFSANVSQPQSAPRGPCKSLEAFAAASAGDPASHCVRVSPNRIRGAAADG